MKLSSRQWRKIVDTEKIYRRFLGALGEFNCNMTDADGVQRMKMKCSHFVSCWCDNHMKNWHGHIARLKCSVKLNGKEDASKRRVFKHTTTMHWMRSIESMRGSPTNLVPPDERRAIHENKCSFVIVFSYRDVAHLNKIAEENASWHILYCKK